MKIAVGLSGGVDSSVAAALLKKEDHEVIGICMKIWDDEESPKGCGDATGFSDGDGCSDGTGCGDDRMDGGGHACYGPGEEADIKRASDICQKLDIPFHVFDLGDEYQRIVIDYFRDEYLAGRTPNPCLRCNPEMKFRSLVDEALSQGLKFEKFATGHYARIEYVPNFSKNEGRYILKKALDPTKDQSYGLIFLDQKLLGRSIFPLGSITKKEVRRIARELDLETHDVPDSQDFYTGDYSDLIGKDDMPGPILNGSGEQIGVHKGIWHYTIGQRKGLRLSTRHPMYVKRIDEKNNAIIVGTRDEIFATEFIAGNLNPIGVEDLTLLTDVFVKIRHAPWEGKAAISTIKDNKLKVIFEEPQWAIAPGQAVGFYKGDIVLGGGIIEETLQRSKNRY